MMHFMELSDGQKIPLVGLGTSAKNQSELESALEEALKIGYRHIDTAYVYQNEVAIGNVLQRWLESGKVKRQDLFIVTKLPPIGMRPKHVGHFLEKSLKNLKLNYVDLYLIHTPYGFEYIDDDELRPMKGDKVSLDLETDLEAVWKSMEDQVDKELTRFIGLSNFVPSQIKRMVQVARIRPAIVQVELNARFQQRKLQKLCKELDIKLCAYSPIGSPGRTQTRVEGPLLIHDPVVIEIASRYQNKTPAQILLRFLVQQNIVVIPKSFNSNRLETNIDVFDFELSCSDMEVLKSMDKGEDGRSFIYSKNGIGEHPEYKEE